MPDGERRTFRAEPQHRGGDFLGRAHPADRFLGDHPLPPFGGAARKPVHHRSFDDPRAAAWPAIPITPAPEEVLTIAPPPLASINGISYLRHKKTPRRFTSTTRFQSSTVVSAVGVGGCSTPALLKAKSRRPNVSTTLSN